MSRRYGHRARRRPTGPAKSSLVQLGLFVFGLVILLSFRSEIADGAAGCFSSIAADEGDASGGAAQGGAPDASVSRPDVGPTTAHPEVPPVGGGTPVSVKVIRHGDADATGARDDAGGGVDAADGPAEASDVTTATGSTDSDEATSAVDPAEGASTSAPTTTEDVSTPREAD